MSKQTQRWDNNTSFAYQLGDYNDAEEFQKTMSNTAQENYTLVE